MYRLHACGQDCSLFQSILLFHSFHSNARLDSTYAIPTLSLPLCGFLFVQYLSYRVTLSCPVQRQSIAISTRLDTVHNFVHYCLHIRQSNIQFLDQIRVLDLSFFKEERSACNDEGTLVALSSPVFALFRRPNSSYYLTVPFSFSCKDYHKSSLPRYWSPVVYPQSQSFHIVSHVNHSCLTLPNQH